MSQEATHIGRSGSGETMTFPTMHKTLVQMSNSCLNGLKIWQQTWLYRSVMSDAIGDAAIVGSGETAIKGDSFFLLRWCTIEPLCVLKEGKELGFS